MFQGGGKRDKLCPSIRLNAPERCETSTKTPIHLNEKTLASSYHWNDWVLRRGALQLANLRKCVTKSQQTDSSHFRREFNTQIYLPRTKQTKTNKCSGSKPPQHVQYFAGVFSLIRVGFGVSRFLYLGDTLDDQDSLRSKWIRPSTCASLKFFVCLCYLPSIFDHFRSHGHFQDIRT